MVAHNGLCLVHRAQLMALAGAWPDALAELDRLRERFTEGLLNQRALGHAAYCEGELHRLRGGLAAAEDAYRTASRLGREPQPGLSLLRLAQAAAKRPPPPSVAPWARRGSPSSVQRSFPRTSRSRWPQGMSTRPSAPVESSTRSRSARAPSCCVRWPLRREGRSRSPRVMPTPRSSRCAALGGPGSSSTRRTRRQVPARWWGWPAARWETRTRRRSSSGATPAIAWVDALAGRAPADDHGLTERELEVLRLVAAGRTDREIASTQVAHSAMP